MDRSAYQEELYMVPASLTLALDKPWSELSAEAKDMINNLCTAVKTRPAPTVIHLTPEAFKSAATLPEKLVVFGGSIAEVPLHQVTSWKESMVVSTHPADALAGNASAKKELWAALQELIRAAAPKTA